MEELMLLQPRRISLSLCPYRPTACCKWTAPATLPGSGFPGLSVGRGTATLRRSAHVRRIWSYPHSRMGMAAQSVTPGSYQLPGGKITCKSLKINCVAGTGLADGDATCSWDSAQGATASKEEAGDAVTSQSLLLKLGATSEAPGLVRQRLGLTAQGLLEMARPHNFGPSCLLALLGSWLASGRDWQVVSRTSVWLVALLSGLISVASMIANDVFDFRSGVDKVNAPQKPLVSGAVHPDDAELAAGCLYSIVVIGCCCLEPITLRLLVGGAAVVTYIYTPFLKKLTAVKNVIVAGIIASSVLAGGLVAGGLNGLNRTLPIGLFLFLSVMMREILMDIVDVVGDKAAGVKTLAVRYGDVGAGMAATAALASAHAVMVRLGPRTRVFGAMSTALLLPIYASLVRILQGSRDPEQLSRLIDRSMLYIGVAVILLTLTL